MSSKLSPVSTGCLALSLGALLLSSCGDDEKQDPNCVDGDSACGATCSSSTPCEAGLHCEDGACVKQCVSADLGEGAVDCPNGAMCSGSGMCVGGMAGHGATSGGGHGGVGGVDNPGGTGAGVGGSSGTGQTGGVGGGSDCPDATVRATKVTPTVLLLIDQSSSMDADFGGTGTRWDVLRNFLLGEPDGLIFDLQSQVRFGLAMYSAVSGGSDPLPIGECPMITSVAPAIDNFQAIADVYGPAGIVEDTPTGDSIDAVINSLEISTNPDIMNDPIVLILATDGEPDRCEELDPQNGQEEAIAAATRAFSMGVRTFIISVGDEVSDQHQQDMANAGLGVQAGDPDAEYWEVGDDASLRAALSEIVGSQLGCEVQLSGSVADGDACEGTVTLNGAALECGDANGWELSTPRTIRLLGSSCDMLKSDPDVVLHVSFPCSVHVVD
jgi:hypothetical protein